MLPRRWLLDTPRGSIHAHTVIHATNGYAAHLLPFLTHKPDRVGIIPTRGQIIATRSSVGLDKLLTPSYSNGFEYWFPRPVNATATREKTTPLVILGGGREIDGPHYEMGITDDSVINPAISKVLKDFLPRVYPEGWFPKDKEPEMEWVSYLSPVLASICLDIITYQTGIMGFTQSGDPLVGDFVIKPYFPYTKPRDTT